MSKEERAQVPSKDNPISASYTDIADQLWSTQPEPLIQKYAALLLFCTHNLDIQQLREYLEQYSIEFGHQSRTTERLKNATGQCHQIPKLVLNTCLQLDNLPSVTRYLFNRFAFSKSAFLATDSFRLPYPERLKQCVDDWTRMMPIIQTMTTQMERCHEGNDASKSVLTANVHYTRLPGLALLTIDRYDKAEASSCVQACTIYAVDVIPHLYIVPHLISIKDISDALQATFGCFMQAEPISGTVRDVILRDAQKLGFEINHFAEKVKQLLCSQDHSLCHTELDSAFVEASSSNVCSFSRATFELVAGLKLAVSAKHGQSITEGLCEMERSKKITVPKNIMKELENGVRNVFFI